MFRIIAAWWSEMRRYVPLGGPPEVNPPGILDWETTVAAWLLAGTPL